MNIPGFLKRPGFWVPAVLILYTALIFRVVWPQNVTLFAQDHNVALMAQYKAELPAGLFTGFWRAGPFLGRMGVHPMTSSFLLLSFLPLEFFFDWIYGAYLLAGSLFFIAFLRQRGLTPLPALTGALTAFWTGSNLTLAHPGHLDKFAVLCFAAATLYGIEKLFNTRHPLWGVFTGGCLGMMAMHQGDVALFFSLPLAAWFLFRLFTDISSSFPAGTAGLHSSLLTRHSSLVTRHSSFVIRHSSLVIRHSSLLLCLLLPLLLMGLEAFRFAQDAHVRGVAVLEEGDPDERWNFATQWSWPPREALDLIAPDFHGRWSGHETRPYTGVMGQSLEWETTGEGFPNFKLESVYLGLIPFALALFALIHSPKSSERIFWAAALLLAFLLAAGKFTPVYALFYRLPLVGSIRNPNKFLQVAQLILGILTAMGAQCLMSATPALRRRFAIGFGIIALLLGLGGLMIQANDPLQLRAFQDTPWAEKASEILRGRQISLLHAAAFGLAAALTSFFFRPRLLLLFPALLSIDGALLARQYLEPFSMEFMRDNPVAETLKERIGPNRVATLESGGLYEHLLHFVFPYHQIPHANLITAPRLGSDIQAYLEEAENDHLRMWRDLGVTYVLMSDKLWQQVQTIPAYRAALHPVMTYSFDGENHRILELIDAPGRFQAENIEITSIEAHLHGFTLKLRVEEPGGSLRLADRHTPDLHARLNRKPHPVQRENILFPVLELPAGEHVLELKFVSTSPTLRAQQVGVVLWLSVLIVLPFSPGNKKQTTLKTPKKPR